MGMLTLAAWLTELAITAATNTTSYVGCLRKPLLRWTPCRQTGLGSSVRPEVIGPLPATFSGAGARRRLLQGQIKPSERFTFITISETLPSNCT